MGRGGRGRMEGAFWSQWPPHRRRPCFPLSDVAFLDSVRSGCSLQNARSDPARCSVWVDGVSADGSLSTPVFFSLGTAFKDRLV